MTTRPSSGRGLHLRFVWQSTGVRQSKEISSLTIDDLRIHACLKPGSFSNSVMLPDPEPKNVPISHSVLSEGSLVLFFFHVVTTTCQAILGNQSSDTSAMFINVALTAVSVFSIFSMYAFYICSRAKRLHMLNSYLPLHSAPGNGSQGCGIQKSNSEPIITEVPHLHRDRTNSDNSIYQKHGRVASLENFDFNLSGSNPSLVDVGCSTSPPLSPSSASLDKIESELMLPVSEENAESKKDGGRKDLLEHIQAHLAVADDDASWRISSMDEVQLLSRIDEGHYGEVFRGRWRGTEVAVKRIKTPASFSLSPEERQARKVQTAWEFHSHGTGNSIQDRASDSMGRDSSSSTGSAEEDEREKLAESFARELSLLKRLRSNRIVLFMGACLGPPDLCIVTEFLPKGSLHDLLHRKKKLPRGRRLLLMVKDIAEGCAFLHAQRIIHRDLKSSNLLLDDNYRVKVADFGLSRIRPGSVEALPTKSWAGTVAYMAPEILRGESGCTESSDCYSFGVVVWEMVTGRMPWKGLEHWEIMQRVGSTNEELPLPDLTACNQVLVEVMVACLSRDSFKRPSFTTVLSKLEEVSMEASISS
eukprot:CAMPEP_0196586308 /NCGR_PEP_ID=MMETSP1081-20130531/53815_1 /TAXON_ID=36882 /ORGANISM="Pyramimonas amylifera, Strain CCMP720" /LENGTH=587 /DNA_ID=CAMNT_0041908145 /DNA_START=1062 /DNA_END=2825 /DNA_ORIENTATION=+